MATPCELYLVRHAIAARRGPEWPDDDARPLTALGVARFSEAVVGLRWLGVAVDEIFTSSLVRAVQTAELLSVGVRGRPPVAILDALRPGWESEAVRMRLAKVVKRRRVALIGHEPGLGELAADLIGCGHPLTFKKGGVCRVDMNHLGPGGAGILNWFVTPKMLRGLARQ